MQSYMLNAGFVTFSHFSQAQATDRGEPPNLGEYNISETQAAGRTKWSWKHPAFSECISVCFMLAFDKPIDKPILAAPVM